ncbi:MAG: redox-sensitive transcriptional activator SoxR [Actinomycetota bacterium]|nr:redox-sensitive transcriptional activator SoxR [Actinomycetota bacterium]
MTDNLPIGDVARRTGVSSSALRFYESQGMIASTRTQGGQRRYRREVMRRIAFIRIAQHVGLPLQEIKTALSLLPDRRAPREEDWERFSTAWRDRLDERIVILQALRGQLSTCIGCGCLSLKRCPLYNPSDAAARLGTGPRYLLGDVPDDIHQKTNPPSTDALRPPKKRERPRFPLSMTVEN